MKIAFTICSANYLPYAISLGDSVVSHNPGYTFIIVLLDQVPPKLPPIQHRLIPVEELSIPHFAEMNKRYNIFQLSCALKSFVALKLYTTEKDWTALLYFDCDMLVFDKLSLAENELSSCSILITPHLSSPIAYKGKPQDEQMMLIAGIFNAGFFGLSRNDESLLFLNWWSERMREYCYNDPFKGFMVDQVWLNFVPVLFKQSKVLDNPGYNLAYWNLGERVLSKKGNGYFVNNDFPLVLLHYSGFDIHDRSMLSKYNKVYTFKKAPELIPLFDLYADSALKNNNGYDLFSIKPAFGTSPGAGVVPRKKKSVLKKTIKKWFKK